MSGLAYAPRAGSHAEHAYQLLLARGTEIEAIELAAAIDLEPASQLHSTMHYGVLHGYFRKRVANGRAYYRLPDPNEPDDKGHDLGGEPVQRIVSASAADVPKALTVFDLADTSAAATPLGTSVTPAPGQRKAAPAAPTPQPEEINTPACPARWGIFSDGDFMLQKGGAIVQLDRGEFQGLLTFLSRVFAENAE